MSRMFAGEKPIALSAVHAVTVEAVADKEALWEGIDVAEQKTPAGAKSRGARDGGCDFALLMNAARLFDEHRPRCGQNYRLNRLFTT